MFSTYDFFEELNRRKVKIRMDVGQPDISPNPKILDALGASLDEMGYGSSTGLDEFREKVAQIYGVDLDHVVVTIGSKFAVAALCYGAKLVSLIAPYWAGYSGTIKYFGGQMEIVETELEDGWMPKGWKPKGEVVVLNYPNNPTGIIPKEDFIKNIVEDSDRRGVLIVSDEVYRDIMFHNKSYSILDYMPKRFAMVHSFSKTFSVPGLRLGYVVGDKETVKKVASFVRATITSAPLFSQRAATRALELLNSERKRITGVYGKRMELFSKLIDRSLFMFLEPDGAFYVFARLPGINGAEFAYKLLERNVGLFPGEAYGEKYKEYIRISLTCSEEFLKEGIETINITAKNWKK